MEGSQSEYQVNKPFWKFGEDWSISLWETAVRKSTIKQNTLKNEENTSAKL